MNTFDYDIDDWRELERKMRVVVAEGLSDREAVNLLFKLLSPDEQRMLMLTIFEFSGCKEGDSYETILDAACAKVATKN